MACFLSHIFLTRDIAPNHDGERGRVWLLLLINGEINKIETKRIRMKIIEMEITHPQLV
jgi:hypothetical protein